MAALLKGYVRPLRLPRNARQSLPQAAGEIPRARCFPKDGWDRQPDVFTRHGEPQKDAEGDF